MLAVAASVGGLSADYGPDGGVQDTADNRL